MNMPIAAPIPPVQGPKSTAKVAGTKTCGQNRTPNTVMGNSVQSAPIAAYNAALIAAVASRSEVGSFRLKERRFLGKPFAYSNFPLFDESVFEVAQTARISVFPDYEALR